jgi:TPR repeat protein
MSLDWYEKAATAGDTDSMASLIRNYYNGGDGVIADYSKSFLWSRKLADLDNAEGQFMLALHYLEGHGVPADQKRAWTWLLKAEGQGYEPAKKRLQAHFPNGLMMGRPDNATH